MPTQLYFEVVQVQVKQGARWHVEEAFAMLQPWQQLSHEADHLLHQDLCSFILKELIQLLLSRGHAKALVQLDLNPEAQIMLS